jgi:F0F1-type ATP synthase membrane subunit a
MKSLLVIAVASAFVFTMVLTIIYISEKWNKK